MKKPEDAIASQSAAAITVDDAWDRCAYITASARTNVRAPAWVRFVQIRPSGTSLKRSHRPVLACRDCPGSFFHFAFGAVAPGK
jgi:hypothetical protein